MRLGELDCAIGVVGLPGTGKSTYALKRARELGAELPAYVVAHDPTRSYQGPDVLRHWTGNDLIASLKVRPRGIHALDVPDGMPVLEVAMRVAELSVKAAKTAESVVPVLVVFDEVVSFTGMAPNYIEPALKAAYALRRHLPPPEGSRGPSGGMLGFLWTTQRPAMVHPTLLDLRTELVMFRLESEGALKRLGEFGVPEEMLAAVPNLPDLHYVVKTGKPARQKPEPTL